MQLMGALKMSVKKLSSVFKTGCELKITRPQAEALKHLYNWHQIKERLNLSYLQFRRTIKPVIGCDDFVMVNCGGIWIGITPEGHRHS
jgi:hypothetical protein